MNAQLIVLYCYISYCDSEKMHTCRNLLSVFLIIFIYLIIPDFVNIYAGLPYFRLLIHLSLLKNKATNEIEVLENSNFGVKNKLVQLSTPITFCQIQFS